MPLRKAISRLVAISFTSAVLLSLSGVAARAATFGLSYQIKDGIAFSALLDGELIDNDQRFVELEALESVTLSDRSGNLLEFDPADLANGKLAINDASAKLHMRDQLSPFAELIYHNDEEDELRLQEAFSYNAYAFQKVNIPENSSVAAMLMAIAGMGLAITKKRKSQQTTQQQQRYPSAK